MSYSQQKLKEIWKTFDYNNNGRLSLAEIDKACLQVFPQFYKKKPVLMRAYKAADVSMNGTIEFAEFENLIRLLSEYEKLFDVFKKFDVNADGRIEFAEFKRGFNLLSLPSQSDAQLKQTFAKMDSNKGGFVLFDEFCIYLAKTKAEVAQGLNETIGLKATTNKAQKMGLTATTSSPAKSSSSSSGAQLVPKLPKIGEKLPSFDPIEFAKMWDVFDSNGNGICSLAEIERAVLVLLPQIYKHRPAIIRAYKSADTDANGFISRREFEKMLRQLAYYDQLFQIFEMVDEDSDRRISFAEFQKGASLLGIEGTKEQFDEADKNKGGFLLFDEFCLYLGRLAADAPSTPRIVKTDGITDVL